MLQRSRSRTLPCMPFLSRSGFKQPICPDSALMITKWPTHNGSHCGDLLLHFNGQQQLWLWSIL